MGVQPFLQQRPHLLRAPCPRSSGRRGAPAPPGPPPACAPDCPPPMPPRPQLPAPPVSARGQATERAARPARRAAGLPGSAAVLGSGWRAALRVDHHRGSPAPRRRRWHTSCSLPHGRDRRCRRPLVLAQDAPDRGKDVLHRRIVAGAGSAGSAGLGVPLMALLLTGVGSGRAYDVLSFGTPMPTHLFFTACSTPSRHTAAPADCRSRAVSRPTAAATRIGRGHQLRQVLHQRHPRLQQRLLRVQHVQRGAACRRSPRAPRLPAPPRWRGSAPACCRPRRVAATSVSQAFTACCTAVRCASSTSRACCCCGLPRLAHRRVFRAALVERHRDLHARPGSRSVRSLRAPALSAGTSGPAG